MNRIALIAAVAALILPPVANAAQADKPAPAVKAEKAAPAPKAEAAPKQETAKPASAPAAEKVVVARARGRARLPRAADQPRGRDLRREISLETAGASARLAPKKKGRRGAPFFLML
jgi:hypothetical protein